VTRGKTWNGAKVLVFGWLGILDSTIAWYANPLFLVSSALFFSKRSSCFHFAYAGLLLALTSFFSCNIWNNKDPLEHIAAYDTGFYLWLFAFIFLIWATWLTKDALD